MEYYYANSKNVDSEKKVIKIDGDEFRHLTKVLRKKQGDEIQITDGNFKVYTCVVRNVSADKLICGILKSQQKLHEPEIRLHLFLSLLRNQSRFETAIEKAVELGVHSITPVITEYTVSKVPPGSSRMERFRKIMLSAMKQSQRCYLPSLNQNIYFDQLPEHTDRFLNKIVMYEFENEADKNINVTGNELCLLIGPEGGFSDKEINFLIKNSWQSVSLGKRKYRAETAAIVSVYKILNS